MRTIALGAPPEKNSALFASSFPCRNYTTLFQTPCFYPVKGQVFKMWLFCWPGWEQPFITPFAGYHPSLIETAVGLLAEVEFSVLCVEQAHGSMSTILRYHPHLEETGLCMRSYAHHVRPLWQRVDIPPAIRMLRQQKQNLLRKQYNRITARQAFLAAAMEHVVVSLGGRNLTQDEKERVLRQHAEMFASLPFETKMLYAKQAEMLQSQKEHLRDSAILEIDGRTYTRTASVVKSPAQQPIL